MHMWLPSRWRTFWVEMALLVAVWIHWRHVRLALKRGPITLSYRCFHDADLFLFCDKCGRRGVLTSLWRPFTNARHVVRHGKKIESRPTIFFLSWLAISSLVATYICRNICWSGSVFTCSQSSNWLPKLQKDLKITKDRPALKTLRCIVLNICISRCINGGRHVQKRVARAFNLPPLQLHALLPTRSAWARVLHT